ncbi:MAG TPA: DUF433 domain-containing protein [Thermoanaerobaculia bacterium]|nr:DUF433 domain-containing protein [Thermoanaerobaculia bacterium]
MNNGVIERDPEIMSGAPVFAGTRVLVADFFDNLAAGDSLEQFLDDFPWVSRKQAVGVLEMARDVVLSLANTG